MIRQSRQRETNRAMVEIHPPGIRVLSYTQAAGHQPPPRTAVRILTVGATGLCP